MTRVCVVTGGWLRWKWAHALWWWRLPTPDLSVEYDDWERDRWHGAFDLWAQSEPRREWYIPEVS